MKPVIVALVCLGLLSGVIALTIIHPETAEPSLFNRLTETSAADTSAQNIVAAILLNYRMYDTVFEAMILLTAVMGMLHFLAKPPAEGDSDE